MKKYCDWWLLPLLACLLAGCGDDDYDDTDIHGGLSEYDDEYWRRRCGFDY